MTGRRLVIFNADDFGLTDGVCRGIREAVADGVVTATTAMVCVSGAEERIGSWGAPLAGRIGIHLQLTEGRACLPPARISTLVNGDAAFPASPAEVVSPDHGQVRDEWSAQIDRLRAWGIEPSHMDSHHHIGLQPRVLDAYAQVASATGLPARTTSPAVTAKLRAYGARCADVGINAWYDGELSAKSLLRWVEAAFLRLNDAGTIEVMCHPGMADADLASKSGYVAQRETELRVLTSAKLRRGLDALDVELASMTSLVA